MRLSKSKLATLKNCAYRFKKEVLENYKPKIIGDALIKGLEVHEILDKAFLVELKEKTIKKEFVKEKIFNNPNYVKHKSDCDNFIKWQSERFMPLYREEKFFDAELNYSGVVDRVDFNERKELTLIDYKTGKGKDSIEGYRDELYGYVYLFEKAHNQEIKRVGILFVTQGKYLEEKVDRNKVVEVVSKIRAARKEINERIKTNKWEKTFSPYCKYCSLHLDGVCVDEMHELNEL